MRLHCSSLCFFLMLLHIILAKYALLLSLLLFCSHASIKVVFCLVHLSFCKPVHLWVHQWCCQKWFVSDLSKWMLRLRIFLWRKFVCICVYKHPFLVTYPWFYNPLCLSDSLLVPNTILFCNLNSCNHFTNITNRHFKHLKLLRRATFSFWACSLSKRNHFFPLPLRFSSFAASKQATT